MKKCLIIILSLVSVLNTKAQDVSKVANNLFRINILTPGLTFEKRITNNNTLCLDTNLGLVYTFSSNLGNRLLKTPFTRLQFRNYYNFDKRIAKGKNTLNNSGNYIALSSSYYFKNLNDDYFVNSYDGLTLGATWGLQRTYKSGLNINLNTGLGYNFSNLKDRSMTAILNFTVGWVLFSKQ